MKTDDQEVTVGATLTVNLAMQVGGARTVVEVQAAGNELQTMNATVGNTITEVAIDNLPSLGRDVSTFVELQPEVGPDGAVAGAALDQSYFSLDGGNNTNDSGWQYECLHHKLRWRHPRVEWLVKVNLESAGTWQAPRA